MHTDKAALARRTANLEAKGYLVCRTEAAFCDYLTATLTGAERETFASLPDRLYTVPKNESRAGFPHFLKQ